MSRSATPVSGLVGSNTGATSSALSLEHSKPISHLGHDTPEYVGTDEIGQEGKGVMQRANSQNSQSATYIPSRGGTLKKKASLHKTGSVKRSGSRKSSYAGSVRSMKLGEKDKYEPEEFNSAFYCPVPTTTSPTELLANRFHAWRRVLKDIISYFRDLHKSYELRSKSLLTASNVINNTSMPADFLSSGGVSDAADILRTFHKQALTEAGKARDLENEVILQLTGLRSDLSQKIKEIKSLSGDFKNSVHKEQDNTRRAVNAFQEALGLVDQDAAAAAGKGDPFLMKLGVERQLERQIEEENYLHRAFLNLEASGRELESIVVGEIQKAYSVLAGILKRDADISYETAEKLREGPLAMARDHEWDAFTTGNTSMVDPRQPLRQVKNIVFDGKNHPAAIEVKSGMLERKSKYLKNYTPGWYILSPTHLHEFKSADQIPFQAPVMSLYLPEQKLGSHSDPGSSSHKFMLKGRQTGSMHRGHTWIFRAETHDTMMAWFSDIRELTEKRGEARNEFVRRTHARSVSAGSQRAASIASGDSQMDEDEADKVAFSGEQSVRGSQVNPGAETAVYGAGAVTGSGLLGDDERSEAGWRPPQRPQPGGRFPSDVNVARGLQAPLSPSSGDSGDEHDREAVAAATALPGSALPAMVAADKQPKPEPQHLTREEPSVVPVDSTVASGAGYTSGEHARVTAQPTGAEVAPDTQSQYHEWVGTAGAGLVGAGAGGLAASAIHRHEANKQSPETGKEEMASANPAIPSVGHSSAPMVTSGTAPAQDDVHEKNEPVSSIYAAYEPTSKTYGTDEPVSSAYETQKPTSKTYGTDEPVSSAYETQEPTSTVHGLNESTNIMEASIYQATTMPSSTSGTNQGADSNNPQPYSQNGDLIGGTDIRAGVGSGTSYSYTQSDYVESKSVQPELTQSRITQSRIAQPEPTQPEPSKTAFAGAGDSTIIRPTPIHTKSVQTISDLHIPGEFPRSATTPTR